MSCPSCYINNVYCSEVSLISLCYFLSVVSVSKSLATIDQVTWQQLLAAIVFPKPETTHIYLNLKSFHPEHRIKNIPKLQFVHLQKIYSDTSGHIKKGNEYINFFTKEGCNSSKLKVLAKTFHQSPVTNSYRNIKKIIIVVAKSHSALKHLPQLLQEKYH